MNHDSYTTSRDTIFMPVNGTIAERTVTIERPFEFFMPSGQRSDGQQWIAASMRLLSLAARAGGSIAKALSDMRQVVWEKGPVRCGFFTREDGTRMPMYHDSEVAAVAFTLQRMLMKRKFLDASANQVPAAVLARQYAERNHNAGQVRTALDPAATLPSGPAGRDKCPECGARALHKVDGCRQCSECHYIGSCG